MCFGGSKSKAPYSAYESGHMAQYDRLLEQREQLIASGKGDEDAGGLWGRKIGLEMGPNGVTRLEALDRQIASLGDSIKKDPAGAAELKEHERQRDISLGKENIDKAFSQFGDEYFDQYKGDYLSYYNPQLEKQYGNAQSKLSAALAGRGMLESTVGADKLSDLFGQYTDTKSQIGNQAQDAANKLRGNVETTKTNLYSLNSAAADPKGMNSRAIGEASALAAPASYDPIGQVFAASLQPFTAYSQAAQNRPRPYSSPVYLPGGSGSGRVI